MTASKRRSSTATRKVPKRKRAAKSKAKRSPTKSKRKPVKSPKPKRSKKLSRSQAAKAGWKRRKARDKIVAAMQERGWEIQIPTTVELYDLLTDLGERLGISAPNMYRMYKGYDPI